MLAAVRLPAPVAGAHASASKGNQALLPWCEVLLGRCLCHESRRLLGPRALQGRQADFSCLLAETAALLGPTLQPGNPFPTMAERILRADQDAGWFLCR